jgi:hypothetical protein
MMKLLEHGTLQLGTSIPAFRRNAKNWVPGILFSAFDARTRKQYGPSKSRELLIQQNVPISQFYTL